MVASAAERHATPIESLESRRLLSVTASWNPDPADSALRVYGGDPKGEQIEVVEEFGELVVYSRGSAVPITSPGGIVQCTITPDDDLLVAWFTADLANAARVDATWTMNGVPIGRFEDIAIDRAHELAIISIEGAMAKAWPDHVAIVTLVAVDGGAERPLAAYTFDHTAFKAPG